MSDPKFKSENYMLMGGLNTKYSPFVLTPMEFLDLRNFDFQQPGSLTQRWGTTMYLGQTAPGPIASLYEFSRLEGPSYVVFSYTGAVFSGATTGQSQGLSFTVQSATFYSIAAIPIVEWNNVSVGGTIITIQADVFGAYYQGDTTAPVYGLGSPSRGNASLIYFGDTFIVSSVVQATNTLSYSTLDDFMFAADGNKFFKYDGVTTYPVGLPPILWATAYFAPGSTLIGMGIGGVLASTQGFGIPYGPSYGMYYFFASYVNNRGFEGNIFPLMLFVGDTQKNATQVLNGPSSLINGQTSGVVGACLTLATPLQYGISSINIYCFYDPYNTSIGQTYLSFWGTTFVSNLLTRFWEIGPPVLTQSIPASGSTITSFLIGATCLTNGASVLTTLQSNNIGPLEDPTPNTYLPLGFTVVSSSPLTTFTLPTGALNVVYSLNDLITPYYPRFLEVYSNRLFLAGFSTTPSTVWFSDVAEPEGYAPDANFEVRTNDADYVTAMKSYSTRLYIFKKNSFHVLSGDNPNDFFLQEVSDQYGALNNRCAVVFGEILAFLDRKGVMTFNGSALSMLSTKVQPYFDNMNYNVALQTACMVHDKIRNQILVAIPANGATINNLILAYDYVSNAWTTYTGLNPTIFDMIQGYNNTKYPLFGDQQGRINWFGPSFIQDNGQGMTAYFKTRFVHDVGDSIQKQFRRLYLNADQQGDTLTIAVNFYQDYGASIVCSTTFPLGAFQQRIDFGISAKALAFDMSAIPDLKPIDIHGFTIEQRMQRRV